MKKRYFKITVSDTFIDWYQSGKPLATSKTIELPFEKAFKDQFIPDLPANNINFLKACEEISMTGFMMPGSDAKPLWVPPSQILCIEVVIEDAQKTDSKILTLAQ